MKNQLLNLTFEVEVQQGEKLVIPDAVVEGVGEGKWMITIQPSLSSSISLSHDSFLSSYSPEDEGLYDGY
jgi:DNA-directed RNA polymerase specialized sigma54-like protein